MKPVLFEKKDKVGYLILNRPQQRNALSLNLMTEMQKQLDIISKNRDINVLVIKGNGPAFCSGHDMNELVGDFDIKHYRNIFSVCSKLMLSLHSLPQPVIAMVHKAAFAAGCQLVAACDLAICDSKTRFSTPGVKIGLFCSTPMVPLCRVINRRHALDMLFTGRMINASEAKDFGLVNKVVEPDKLIEETDRWAYDISGFSLKVLEFGKKTFYDQIDMDEKNAYNYSKEAIAQNCLFYDAQEGMRAFLEKRKPKWKNK